MLIKQWAEVQAARHTLDDDDDAAPILPTVSSNFTKTDFNYFLVIPQSMAVLLQSMDKTAIGSVKVEYSNHANEESKVDDLYDEEEQLYSGFRNELPANASLPLFKIGSSVAIEVPHFKNEITEKFVAEEIAELAANSKVIILAPCQGLLNGSIFKMSLPSCEFATVKNLQPPHYISGTGAALVSRLSATGKSDKMAALLLSAEGHRGFEKIDADSLMDAARHVFQALSLDSDKLLKQLSTNVRKLNSANTSGMYL